jgi:hypothetical protein
MNQKALQNLYCVVLAAGLGCQSAAVYSAPSDVEVGEMVGRYVAGAGFIESVAAKCPAFAGNRITMEASYRKAVAALPARLSSSLAKPELREALLRTVSAYEGEAAKIIEQNRQTLNEDTRCGLVMGIALGIHHDGKRRLEELYGPLPR